MILKHFSVLLLFLNCVRTKDDVYDYGMGAAVTEIEQRYSYWPSLSNGLRLWKRDLNANGASEGGDGVNTNLNVSSVAAAPPLVVKDSVPAGAELNSNKSKEIPAEVKVSGPNPTGNAIISNTTVPSSTGNGTAAVIPKQLDLSNPGVLMRGVIVFGGFLLMAVFYYIFYRTKSNKNETSNTHNTNDSNQFRYGVLHSEDRRDNLELSRIPLTMESDEDEDEDLEIFDLGQKKQSLSYVNLHTNDEDIVFPPPSENGSTDKNNLLLDIEDASTDPLINWSNNANKSIL